MKIDLHCHSKHSKRATIWLMQKLGCPESFTEPLGLYHLALRRGMSAVTITDHNSIDGCLEIAHHDRVFMGCEYTTYFPEDRCKVHVLVHGISEAQHADLQKARENIYDLVTYTNTHGLHYSCAHPLYSVNDRLVPVHIEKLILLFKNFELNGDVHPDMNARLRTILTGLSPNTLETLANKHGMAPSCKEPWLKNLIGGSDDHSALRLGKTFTEVAGSSSIAEFWDGVENGQAHVHTEDSTPQTFARNTYGIMYQFCRSRFDLDRYKNKDLFLQFLERMFQSQPETPEPLWARLTQSVARLRRPRRSPAENASLLELVRFEADRLLRNDAQLVALLSQGAGSHNNLDAKLFECVNQVSNNMLLHLGRHVLDRVLHTQILELIQALGSATVLYLMLAPYFIAFSIRAGQRSTSKDVAETLMEKDETRKRPRVAHFTDTLHEVNGVARTLHRQLASAQALGKDYTVVTVSPERQAFQRGIHYFHAVGSYDLPEYPEIKLLYPPFLQMLDHCYKEGFTHLHASTPGLVGLSALAIARILKLPISGTYHTAIPQYAKALTEDTQIEDMMWKYMVWFYDQMDYIYAPSHATAEELTARGINPDKVRVYPRGVDTERFQPAKRDNGIRDRFGIPQDRIIMLYVGRVSKEKGLSTLSQAFRSLASTQPNACLVIVGDGPYRQELEAELTGVPVVFTGYVEGDELPKLYASSDFLVFPSATDTFGNVVLEAHASGIPVIVTDKGGPRENTTHGETGLIVEAANAAELSKAIILLSEDEALRKRMGEAGRRSVEERGFQRQFEKLWDMYVRDDTPRNEKASVQLDSMINAATEVFRPSGVSAA